MLHAPDPLPSRTSGDVTLAGWRLDEAFLARALDLAQDAAVVSLDVFDTSLTRLLDSPADVFAETERRLAASLGKAALGYAQARENAERDARLWCERSRGTSEAGMPAIMQALGQRLPMLAPHLDAAMQTELAVEQSVLAAVPDMLELTRRLRAMGKPAIFVSDMYLSAEAIARLLRQAGYEDAAGLYVSCETGAAKATGRQWQVVRLRHAGPILHIGDDPVADGRTPQAHGVRTLLYERARSERRVAGMLRPAIVPFSRAARAAALRRRAVPAASGLHIRPDAGAWQQFGAGLGAILVGAFLRWLEGRVRLHRIDRLYFCSRDGWLLREAWKVSGLDRATGIEGRYLCVSRRPLNLARGYAQSSPGRLQPALLAFLSGDRGQTTIGAALSRIGLLDDPGLLSDLRARGHTPDDSLAAMRGDGGFAALLADHAATVYGQLRQGHADVTAYLRQEDVGAPGRCAIVDMGWHGNIQRALRGLIEAGRGRAPLIGFYYGLWPGALGNRYEAGLMEAAFASDFKPVEEQEEMREAVDILEELHGAPHGTVTSYREREGKWHPVFAENLPEQHQYETATRHFQDGVLAAIAALFTQGAAGALRLEDLTREAAIAAAGAVFLSPSSHELSLLGSLRHDKSLENQSFEPVICLECPADDDAMEQDLARSSWRIGTLRAWHGNADTAGRTRIRRLAATSFPGRDGRILRQFD